MLSFPVLAALSIAPLFAGTSVVEIPRDNTNRPIPTFSNGYTIFIERTPPMLHVFDSKGALKIDASLSLPDGSSVRIQEAVATEQGGLVVATTSMNSSSQRSALLFFLDSAGKTERVVPISPFIVSHIATGPDNTIWAVGWVTDGIKETDNHNIVQIYDVHSGQLLRTALPRAAFADKTNHPCARCFIAANGKSMGFFSALSNEYVELDAAGVQVNKWTTGALPSGIMFTHAGLTSNGDFYIGGGGILDGKTYKIAVFRLDKQTSTFIPVDLGPMDQPNKPSTLLGADGNRLVLYGKPTSTIWIDPKLN